MQLPEGNQKVWPKYRKEAATIQNEMAANQDLNTLDKTSGN